jgi:hypothetical protein
MRPSTMRPCFEGNSAHWTSREMRPLVIERLENHSVEALRAFREKMGRISGINYVVDQILIEDMHQRVCNWRVMRRRSDHPQ